MLQPTQQHKLLPYLLEDISRKFEINCDMFRGLLLTSHTVAASKKPTLSETKLQIMGLWKCLFAFDI